MRLFRVFDWHGRSLDHRFGGPLCVRRERQGTGRHDVPELSVAWYLSQSPVAAVAETLQYLRGHTITADDFARAGGMRKALATIDLTGRAQPIDLDLANWIAWAGGRLESPPFTAPPLRPSRGRCSTRAPSGSVGGQCSKPRGSM